MRRRALGSYGACADRFITSFLLFCFVCLFLYLCVSVFFLYIFATCDELRSPEVVKIWNMFFLNFIQEIYYQSNYKELIKKNLINIF